MEKKGNFIWDGKSSVKFVPDENGRFIVGYDPFEEDKFELEENDWEILEFISEGYKFIRLKKSDMGYSYKTHYYNKAGKIIGSRSRVDLDFNRDTIHKVKRLSDGETFEIGDKVTNPPGQSFVISKFYMNHDNTKLLCNGERTGAGHISINKITKVKQPILTTEDGKPIYDGDKIYTVKTKYDPSRYICREFVADNNLNYQVFREGIFSSEESAEQYIEDNKPQFNKKDMIDFAWYFYEQQGKPVAMVGRDILYNWLKQRKDVK